MLTRNHGYQEVRQVPFPLEGQSMTPNRGHYVTRVGVAVNQAGKRYCLSRCIMGNVSLVKVGGYLVFKVNMWN